MRQRRVCHQCGSKNIDDEKLALETWRPQSGNDRGMCQECITIVTDMCVQVRAYDNDDDNDNNYTMRTAMKTKMTTCCDNDDHD